MKGRLINKILVILLAIVMVLSLSVAAFAEESPAIDTTIRDRIDHIIVNQGRAPSEQAEYEEFTRLLKMKEDSSRINKMFEKKYFKKLSKDEAEIVAKSVGELKKQIPWILDAANGGDFDWATTIDSVLSSVSTVLACCGPYGQLASAIIDIGNTIMKLAMGGEAGTSEIAQMEDRLNQRLDDIQNQLSGIEDQINGLSNEINNATNEIINGVTVAIDNAFAKQQLSAFMLTSGKYDFGYNQYRNYIYGETEKNSMANTAYYSLLKKSSLEGSSDTTKYYYDALYTALMDNWTAYYEYIIGTSDCKPIVQCYYDVVSARPDLMRAKGTSAEYEAIMFAYDVYQTELMASQIISSCNFYQYAYMYATDTDTYIYDQYNGGMVEKWQAESGIQNQIDTRLEKIHDQLAHDILYILNLDDSYVVESADDNLFEVVNSDPDIYGNVLVGQTIYLNRIPEEVCDLFGFDSNDFTYTVSVHTNIDGVFTVDSNAKNIKASLCYKEKEIDSISFKVGTNSVFFGGDGTASNPYLIASPAGVKAISDGVDKHYRLIDNIDFGGETITPIGQRVNSNNDIVYDEFVGSFDGNGYTICNLNVVGYTNTGLFGIIGENGEVADLKLYNVKVSANITNAEKSTSEFYAGMIAGKNNGIIKYCSINSDGTTTPEEVVLYEISEILEYYDVPDYIREYFEALVENNITDIRDVLAGDIVANATDFTKTVNLPRYGVFLDVNNKTKNRNIYAYAGGIAGGNNYVVAGCTVKNNHISASSTHSFGGDATTTNKNNVYVGGICGYSTYSISHSIVEHSAKISSYAKSIYNPQTTVNPYVVARAGGVVAKVNSIDGIYEVESYADIIQNSTVLECESDWGRHYKNCSYEKNTYIPGFSESELKAIMSTKSIEEFIAETERNYKPTLEPSNTVYEPGNTLTHKFKYVKSEEDLTGIVSDLYVCDSLGYTLIISSDGKGILQDDHTTLDFTYTLNDDGTLDTKGESLTQLNILGLQLIKCETDREVLATAPNSFVTENIKFFINGEEKEYEIVDVYGFDTQNAGFSSMPKVVTVLLSVEIDGKTAYFAQNITATINENVVTGIEILNLKDSYVKDTFSLGGLVIKYNYAVGDPEYVTIDGREHYGYCEKCHRYPNEALIDDGKHKYCGGIITQVDAPKLESGNISDLMIDDKWVLKRDIEISFNGEVIPFVINVVCNHGTNFTDTTSGYTHDDTLSKAPTCSAIGYDAYRCDTCGDVKYYYLRKTEHTYPEINAITGYKAPTCGEEGNTGKVLCADEKCGELLDDGTFVRTVLIDGKVIPKLEHNYVYVDENKHACVDENGEFLLNENGEYLHSEYHHYTVTESVKSKTNADGSESWYIVYRYTCVCQKDGQVFTKEVTDENLIVDANTKLPTIMVSDGYALSAGDEVVVYVQLLNNPGINAANFGIRYSEGLELISIQDGTVLKGSLVTDGLAVNYGYNFVWGDDSLFSNDGNLLRLTFRVSEYAELGDSYDISLVYAIGNGAQGGFGTSAGKQYFITKDGAIKVVERLPGDINNDGIVDLLDAIEIGKFVVGKTDSIDEMYANVDLSHDDHGASNVDIMDMVAILQYITGGYGANLLTQDFEIVLNTNGYGDVVLDDLLVSIYGNNNTYDEAGLAELERQGYKFLGWFDQMVGGNRIDISGDVEYNPNQKKQTLYAQWELNQLVFDANGGEGTMPDVYYTEDSNIILENKYINEYKVVFVSDKCDNQDGVLWYEFLGWMAFDKDGNPILDKDGNAVYYDAKNNVSFEEVLNDFYDNHYGVVTLVADWSEKPILKYPKFLVNGYEDTVHWYGDSYYATDEIRPGINNEYILELVPVAGKYIIYAKHIPIVYDIVFDFNGGSGTVPGSSDNVIVYKCSVENSYDLSRVSVSNAGNTFKVWAVDVDGVHYKDFGVGETIEYLPNATQNSIITVKAIWNEESYTINYVLNGGNLSDSEKIDSYRISELDKMELPTPTYPKYPEYNRFIGWYRDLDGNQPFDISELKTNPENITLYAKWDKCHPFNFTNTPDKISPQNIDGNRAIVDWSEAPNGMNDNARTISIQDVSEIYFIGKSGITYENLILVFSAGLSEKANIIVHFIDFNMTGVITRAVSSVGVNLALDCIGEKDCIGENSIIAPLETTAISGFESLTITGSGNLEVKGGDGVSATTEGGAGTDGAIAIIVGNLTIDMEGSLTVVGGNGGAGKAGTNASTSGANGGNGGNGGNGAVPVNCITINALRFGSCSFVCGNGGDGGAGGAGAAGLVGRMDLGSKNYRNGGAGGAGGSGGNGGNAGYSTQLIDLLKNTAISLDLGEGGDGGVGGRGGNGGNGGPDIGTLYIAEPYGLNGGDGGVGGRGGNGGNGRVAGFGGAAGESGKGGKGTSEGWIGGTKKGTTGKTPESLGAGTDGMTLQYP